MPLTSEQHMVLYRLERDPQNVVTDDDRRICPGLHFCPDWDYAAICVGAPEWEACTCPKSMTEAIGRTEHK